MRFAALLIAAIVMLPGCASMLPDTPRITEGTERPSVDSIRAGGTAVPMSVAIHIAADALESHAVEHHRSQHSTVWDYGALRPYLGAAVRKKAPEAFERVFYTPQHPNTALWGEGIDFVVSIESARANYFVVKDGEREHGLFQGWEVVLVTAIYSIDGRPLGFHESPTAGRKAFYRTEVVAPQPLHAAADKAGLERAKHCGGAVDCTALSVELLKESLAYAVEVAVGQALRRFPATEAQRYLDAQRHAIDLGYGIYLSRKESATYRESLRGQPRAQVAALTPKLDRPTVDKVKWIVAQLRLSAQLSALSGAVSGLQAQNFARMGMHREAATSSMVSRLNHQVADMHLNELARAGAEGLDRNTKALLMLLGGLASYSEYRTQKLARQGIVGGDADSDPRCSGLLRRLDQAASLRETAKAIAARRKENASGLGGSQFDAADAYRRVYRAYCT